ncbi:MAG: YraN family protein [Saprospiraceae bacterium]|nr:YraN family protein [Saprospiraceae bacterium]MDZ4705738.1 YraN family protein [Saprospiraceae bacterium]
MAAHNEIGKAGELAARRLLENKGYLVLEANWRFHRAEVDLIAKDGKILVFIEVKTRSSDAFGKPEAFVDARKQRFLAEAASAYMEQIGHDWEIRFDIISVLTNQGGETLLEHFEDAFFPGW